MMQIKRTSIFKREFKRMTKKHYSIELFETVLRDLYEYDTNELIRKYKDHALKGDWQGYRELHIQSDWLLIYKIEQDRLILTLTRTGSHDDLFK